jgi:hypothetical protein
MTPFNVDDLKISKLLSDPDGGTTTYNAPLDVPGIQSINFEPDFLEKELMGDAQVLDTYTKLRYITGQVKHGRISLEVLALLTGGTLSSSGSSPNTQKKLVLNQANLPGYFKMEGVVEYLGGDDNDGDYHTVFLKTKISKFSIEHQGEDYATVSFDWKAIPRRSDGNLLELVENETAVAIPDTSDTTPPTVTSTSPNDGDTGVSASTNVTFTFSEAMAPNTASDPANFYIVKDDGTNVPFAISYASGSTATTLNPTSDLDPAGIYIAGATKGVRDAAGNAMAAAHVIVFTVAP